ncbi:MAG: methionyl-tRNA formyltransferase [Synechococcales cyanobacterium T60_A2020_003]|nr:methionyl-tRNA formyltransferase [Synechococcales cyanobacterium T60_A2020_003]
MKVVFFGTPQFAVPTLQRLLDHERFDVLAVVTQPDKRRGRGNDLIPSPVKAIATEANLPVWQPTRVKKDQPTLDALRATQADAFVVVAYGQILSQEILDMPRLGCINGHGSILPQYRGAAPIQWCLYHGETETGVTTMLMDAGMDTGGMLIKTHTPINLLDNAHDLAKILSVQSADAVVETLIGLEQNTITPIPQDNDQATYAPLIQKADYGLDWSRSAIALHNQIRGFYPNCFATLRDKSLKISATVPLNAGIDLPDDLAGLETEANAAVDPDTTVSPGTIVAILKGEGPVVQTGEGWLLLQEVQLAGKRSQSGWDVANGLRLEVGEVLTNGTLAE